MGILHFVAYHAERLGIGRRLRRDVVFSFVYSAMVDTLARIWLRRGVGSLCFVMSCRCMEGYSFGCWGFCTSWWVADGSFSSLLCGYMYVETGGWRLHRFLCDLVPCAPLAVVPVLCVVCLWPVRLSCVFVFFWPCVPVFSALLVCACACWYGSHCTWAVAAAARSLRRLLSRFCMRLSLGRLSRTFQDSSWPCARIHRVRLPCEGWTPVCVKLREPQLILAFNWPPACTMLGALNAVGKVATMGATGLVSEAAKYDATVKSKCFSQNIDSGVSILSAQTDVQHCASTVVATCTKYCWTTSPNVFMRTKSRRVGCLWKVDSTLRLAA